jgi:DNA-binding winged helix-turn-helix (wHTH) protein
MTANLEIAMEQTQRSKQTLRFGMFEADVRAGELYKAGRRIKLQEQPFRVLALLLDRPAELVTREELRQKLWSADTSITA